MKALLKSLGLLLLFLVGQPAMAGTVTYVYTDPQGTPLAEANASGAITATFDYAPYGRQALGTAPNGPGYTGHVNDPDTGLVYMQARYYDPEIGHMLSVDPVGPSPGSIFSFNRYDYANNNPINNTDPDGRCPTKSGCTEAIPYSFFRNTSVGRFASNTFGRMAAVFSSTNTNPMSGEVLDRGQLQEAKLGIAMLAVPGPGKSEAVVADALKPMARGVAAEARVLLDMGLTKNTQAVATAEGRAIPDALTSTMSLEIKDTASVYATKQVRIQTGAAAATAGQESVLVTGLHTYVSGPAAASYDRIIRRADLGPQR